MDLELLMFCTMLFFVEWPCNQNLKTVKRWNVDNLDINDSEEQLILIIVVLLFSRAKHFDN